MSSICNVALKWGRAGSSLLHLAAHGEHPLRIAFVRAYVRLHLKMWLSAIIGRPVRSFSLAGNEMQFTDPHVFSFLLMEIFIEETYKGCDPPPATIVDLGSNIGMSILWFKSRWPGSSILGVEASPEIFALLQHNVRGLPGVTVANRAVSDHAGQIMFYSISNSLTGSINALRGGSTGTMVDARPMSEFITGAVDLLKIDVEGSEITAFAELEASGKLVLIRQMLIEYHHHLPNESGSLAAFLERLERNGFQYDIAAELPDVQGCMQDVLIRAQRL